MRFLNLKLSSPYTDDLKISFSSGLNILSIPGKDLFTAFKQIPITGMYATGQGSLPPSLKNISCTINISYDPFEGEACLMSSNGDLTIKESELPGEIRNNDGGEISESVKKPDICSMSDFVTSSYFIPEQIQKNGDPVFEKEKIKSLLINNEIIRLDSPFFQCRETILSDQDKELTDLNRERQLLELKKMKKEKMLKEISITERGLHKLEKRRESILKYKAALTEIITKNEARNKLSSKSNNLKKDLIELKEIKEKISSVEDILKEKFSHFSEKGNEQIPDLEQIQESFNSFRDVNEHLDKFFLNKKHKKGLVLRIISSLIIFSLIAFIFLMITSSASFILGLVSGASAAAAGFTTLFYHFKIGKKQPSELFEQKKKMENNLIDLLKKNNFSVDDYKTGELYEILFQYFEDFINYRDISYELADLKKKISNSASLIEKEKKLDQFTEEIENIDKSVEEIIENLDLSIHPRPEPDNITRALHDIDELITENGTEINEKKSLVVKFENEIEEYDKTENSSLSSELRLEEILARIAECKEKIEHIKFLDDIFKKASEIWAVAKLEELSSKTLEIFLRLTDNSFIKEDISETINNVIIQSGRIKSEHRGLKRYISFSIKAALSELLYNRNLPPVFIIDPFTPDNEFADNMKKLLPELFPERQVVVIVPGNDPELKGNLITL